MFKKLLISLLFVPSLLRADILYPPPCDGTIVVQKPSGACRTFNPAGNSDTARGTALVAAVNAMATNDAVILGPGTYQTTATLTLPSGGRISGVGDPLISAPALGANIPAITVTTTNITLENFRVQSNVTCIGLHSATPQTITGLTIRNVQATVSDTDANALMISETSSGGAAEHTVGANIYSSVFTGGTVGGFGIFMSLTSSSVVNLYNLDVYGATDGILNKNGAGTSTGVTNIYGGKYRSVLDAITSGGTGNVINVFGADAQGDQADLYGDDGTLNVYWVKARPGLVVGNGINYTGAEGFLFGGSGGTMGGQFKFAAIGGGFDTGLERSAAATVEITDASTGVGSLSAANATLSGNVILSGALSGIRYGGAASLAAAGTNQGTAATIATRLTFVTGANGTVGVALPASFGVGDVYYINNTSGASVLNLYATGADTINGAAGSGAQSVAAQATAVCFGQTADSAWRCSEIPSV